MLWNKFVILRFFSLFVYACALAIKSVEIHEQITFFNEPLVIIRNKDIMLRIRFGIVIAKFTS